MARKTTKVLKLTKDDKQMLVSLAEYRILTMGELGVLHDRNIVALRRRMTLLKGSGLIDLAARTLRHTPGRPENLLSLTPHGVALLKTNGLLGRDVPCDNVTANTITCIDHQLLTNTFRVELIRMERLVPMLRVCFLAPTSPFTPRADSGLPPLQEKFTSATSPMRDIEFLPDGVFVMTHQALRKSLLFFLEVDMGTQTLVSSRSAKRDVRQKILNYQAFFEAGAYRRYETTFHDAFLGFRLLFLTTDAARLSSLARLVSDNQPADFIWLTDRASLETVGAGGRIWIRGGRQPDDPRESILGSMAPKTEGPVSKRR